MYYFFICKRLIRSAFSLSYLHTTFEENDEKRKNA